MPDGQQVGRLLLIQIGNGATPEVFSNLCGITTRSFNMSANEVDTTIPDCANPGNTPQRTAEPGIKNRTFSGSGKFVKSANSTTFMTHVNDATVFNAKVIVPGLGTYTGAWFVSEFEFSGEMEGNMDFSATFVAAGPLTFEVEA
ncbi:phage tail tube protein [Rhizobium sp. LC145]|uniref:phage tail tube protein n=1 Tax=Rhizobium sp. LC145 TaxID=1120688 RepID=UPI00062A0A44|nr:phage tail tube protein [Rhizobium sp. LC145]KKX33974.1 phage tail protein [Rhizobium sp. LC145]TKT67059.1 phage tail protein [Rhizobiaceae bacterium LC148]